MKRFLLVAFLLTACDTPPPEPPPVAAQRWAKTMNIQVDGITCAGTDSDGDGYVSCDLSVHGDKVQIISIQCASGYNWSTDRATSGCKSTQPKVR